MAAAELEKLRNVGILGQGGSGKTSLGEAMLFAAGATQRLGRVQDGTSAFNHEPEEIKHQVSISTAFHSLSWKKNPMTLIDTPGYAAFLADSLNSMRAFRGGLFVLNPTVGLRVESERLWAKANEDRISRLLFVAKMDHEPAGVEERIDSLLEGLEAKGVYLQLPIGTDANFKGVVDLLTMKAYLYDGDSGKCTEAEIPGELKDAAEKLRQKLLEDVSETDDALLEKFLDGKELSVDELKKAIRDATRDRKMFPILYGSALRQIGITQVLDAVNDYLPSPLDEGEVEGKHPGTGEVAKRKSGSQCAVLRLCFQNHQRPLRRQAIGDAGHLGKNLFGRDLPGPEQTKQRKNRSYVSPRREKTGRRQRSLGGRDRRRGEAQGSDHRRHLVRREERRSSSTVRSISLRSSLSRWSPRAKPTKKKCRWGCTA